jgi:glutathione S-transferase
VIRLHDNLSSGNGYKARLLLAQLGIPFERVEYDIDEAETRTPEFLEKVNLNGRVPVLETEDGRFLPESNAILSMYTPPALHHTSKEVLRHLRHPGAFLA